MNSQTYLKSVEACMEWIELQMLTFDGGYHGMYERIRINEHIRVNWVRPDCNTELLRTLTEYERITGSDRYAKLAAKIKEWVLRAQDNDPLSAWHGSFPFFLVEGTTVTESGRKLFQNDNGRIMIALLHAYEIDRDPRLLESAANVADYWISIQRSEGNFVRKDGKTWELAKGPDFVLWLAAGLLLLHQAAGGEKYKTAALKAYDYLLALQLEDGRLKTSYELELTEDWRPLSSETAKALYSFSVAYRLTKDERYATALKKAGAYTLSLQHNSGGILNNDARTKDAALQNNENLCDLVYTQGFALMALIEAWQATGDINYKEGARKLANFLTDIQCNGESPLWDGAWRGSYNVATRQWDGRADQNNHIDEGGMYSVYTGWTATNNMFGLLRLHELSQN